VSARPRLPRFVDPFAAVLLGRILPAAAGGTPAQVFVVAVP
jgi:hypothetical protein